ncbi:MAG: hypothetical protein ACJAT7_000686 [Psychromonas sp.]
MWLILWCQRYERARGLFPLISDYSGTFFIDFRA